MADDVKLRKLVGVILGSTDLNEATAALGVARKLQPDGKLPAPLYSTEDGLEGIDWRTLFTASMTAQVAEAAQRSAVDDIEVERRLKEDPPFRKRVNGGRIDDERMKSDPEYKSRMLWLGRMKLDEERKKAKQKTERTRIKTWLVDKLAEEIPGFVAFMLPHLREGGYITSSSNVTELLVAQACMNAEQILYATHQEYRLELMNDGRLPTNWGVEMSARNRFDGDKLLSAQYVDDAFRSAVEAALATTTAAEAA